MKNLVKILTVLLIVNISAVRVFADGDDTFTPFTDVDPDTLVDITNQYSLSDIYFNVSKEIVIDAASSYALQQQYNVLGSHTISFTGSYYDNSIVGINACSSSGYSYNTSVSNSVNVVEIEPGIYGTMTTPGQYGNNGLAINFGLSYDYQTLSSSQIQGTSFENSTQACKLVGMETGDGAIDGTTLLQAGYEKRTITYNDGTSAGHTATFYVPGSESINISNSDLDDLIDAIYSDFLNGITIDYHYEYELSASSHRKIMPSYGFISSGVWLPLIFEQYFLSYSDGMNDYRLSFIGNDHADVNYNYSFLNGVNLDNIYQYNYTQLYWSDTTNPHWIFKTDSFRDVDALTYVSNGSVHQDNDPLIFNDISYNGQDNYRFTFSESTGTINVNSTQVTANPDYLTAGYKLPYGPRFTNDYKFYKVSDSGRLGLFNQLGNFLQNQFNRISNLIGNIDGSGDTVNDIENTYNIDLDTDLNNYISNFITRKNAIDLTQPEYNLPSGNNVNQLSDIPAETIKIFTDNGVGVLIFAPLILGILRLIL